VRNIPPWHTGDGPRPEGPRGDFQVDFAYDEVLVDPPALMAVPRAADGRAPLWAATAAQSLMWKLQWLATDHARLGYCEGKDLYDAVLLAEMGPRPSPRLRRRLRSRLPTPDALDEGAAQRWRVDWSTVDDSHRPSDGSTWLARLANALDREWAAPAPTSADPDG
jgi:hypothetical protein